MPNDVFRVPFLTDLLEAAAIPYDGVTVTDINAVPPVVTIQYAASATAQQIADGEAIKSGFDWRRRRKLGLAAVRTTLLNALTASERNSLVLALAAHLLIDDPRRSARVLSLLGFSGVAVDEVDPT